MLVAGALPWKPAWGYRWITGLGLRQREGGVPKLGLRHLWGWPLDQCIKMSKGSQQEPQEDKAIEWEQSGGRAGVRREPGKENVQEVRG